MNANPVVSEILAGALRAIEEEVEELLARVWRSPSLRDAGDFSVCLFDRFGRALTGRALASGPAPVLRAHPEIAEGDVFLHNDPYAPPAGLGEAPELCLTRPLFADGALLAFLQIRGRHDDVGGALPGGRSGGARESYHEASSFRRCESRGGTRPSATSGPCFCGTAGGPATWATTSTRSWARSGWARRALRI